MRTELGKIQNCFFGMGGYDGAMIGFTFTLGGKSWGVGDFWGQWSMDPGERAKWSDGERRVELGNCCMRVLKLLEAAKAKDLNELIGTPIEVTFEGNTLKSWRILEEVV